MRSTPSTTLLTRLLHSEISGGIALIVFTSLALIWANSAWSSSYSALWDTHAAIGSGALRLDYSLRDWVNDALMAVFFFWVGLTIKREMLIGELSSMRKAALPIAAALGGMIAPALIYLAFNGGTAAARGWGVPIATDIAFALGILALLGRRVPIGLTAFLAALAIADDLGAVAVIALFYGNDLSMASLGVAVILLSSLAVANRFDVRRPGIYIVVGILVWLAVLKSGIHPTVAGVLVAMCIPVRSRVPRRDDSRAGSSTSKVSRVDDLRNTGSAGTANSGEDLSDSSLPMPVQRTDAPSRRLELALTPWVSFAIMPVFALANAGVEFQGSFAVALSSSVTLGVALALFVGKQIGILLFAWLAVIANIGALPGGTSWRHIYGAALLGGIGFTMSLFIASIGFDDLASLNDAKVGILVGSVASAVVGWAVLRSTPSARSST